MADWRVQNRTLVSKTTFMLESGKFSDVKLIVGPEENKQSFLAHKNILAANSSVFESMLFGNTFGDGDVSMEGNDDQISEGDGIKSVVNDNIPFLSDDNEQKQTSNEIRIPDDDPQYFSTMLRYFYSEDIKLESLESAISICSTSAKYKVFSLQEKCEEYMIKNLSPEESCRLYNVADTLKLTLLLESCLSIFTTYTKVVIESEGFLSSKINTVIAIIEKSSLSIPSESFLFKAIIDWGIKEQSRLTGCELRTILEPLLPYIRFLFIPPNDLIETSEKYGIPSYKELCALLLWMMKPNTSLTTLPDIFSGRPDEAGKPDEPGNKYKKTNIVYFSARDEQFTEVVGKQISFAMEVRIKPIYKVKPIFIHKFSFPYRAKGRTFSSFPVTVSLTAPDRFLQLKFVEELTTSEVYGLCSVTFPRCVFLRPGEIIEVTLLFGSSSKGFECKTVDSDGSDCQSFLYEKRVGGWNKPVDTNEESLSLFVKRIGMSNTTLVIKSFDYEN